MNKEEFIKQRCEIDKITEEEFEEQYRVVKCNCGQPYCNGYRCLDLDALLKENQELKKQVEERTKMYQNAYDYSQKMEGKAIILENQQKEFIKYLEDEIKKTINTIELLSDSGSCRIPYLKSKKNFLENILQKYKEIIRDDK